LIFSSPGANYQVFENFKRIKETISSAVKWNRLKIFRRGFRGATPEYLGGTNE